MKTWAAWRTSLLGRFQQGAEDGTYWTLRWGIPALCITCLVVSVVKLALALARAA